MNVEFVQALAQRAEESLRAQVEDLRSRLDRVERNLSDSRPGSLNSLGELQRAATEFEATVGRLSVLRELLAQEEV